MSPLLPRCAPAVPPTRRRSVSEDAARARKLEHTVEALRDEVCAPRRASQPPPPPLNPPTNQSSSCLSFSCIRQLAEEQELCAALRAVAEAALAAADDTDTPSSCTASQRGASKLPPPRLTTLPSSCVTAAERAAAAELAAVAAAEREAATERVATERAAAIERAMAAEREIAAKHAAEESALALSNARAALDAERGRTAALRLELAELQRRLHIHTAVVPVASENNDVQSYESQSAIRAGGSAPTCEDENESAPRDMHGRVATEEAAENRGKAGISGQRDEAGFHSSLRRRRRDSGPMIPPSPGLRLVTFEESSVARQLVMTRDVF